MGIYVSYSYQINMVIFKQEYITLFNWINSLPKRKSAFKDSFRGTFSKARDASILAINLTCICAILCEIAITILLPLSKYLFSGDAFPLPSQIHLPFLHATNPVFYFINYSHQIYVMSFALVSYLAVYSFSFTIIIHAWIHLEGIKVLVGNMNEGIAIIGYENWLKSIAIELEDVKR